ncbi:MAG: hypothetical protein N3D09_04940 [Archaeoglobaceae archaeon]|nr:hypothetical protein [Archaeoglobaceae archaeon]
MYPGQYEYWQILWLQIILLVYIQFLTGFSLYTQKESYSKPFKLLEKFLPWKGRDFLIKLHAFSGISVFLLNILCTATWFYSKLSGGLSFVDILTSGETALIGWTNLVSTSLIFLMFLFGVSLYKNNRPDTTLPFWRFEYYASKLIHRLAFFLLVLTLGYHIFFIPKIFSTFIDWITLGHLFVLIPITSILIGILAFLLAFMLLYEIVVGKMRLEKEIEFSKTLLVTTLIFIFYILYSIFLQPLPFEPFLLFLIFLAFLQVMKTSKSKKAPRTFYNFRAVSEEEIISKLLEMKPVYGNSLIGAIDETLEHAFKVWKESMDFNSELEYCGSIFAGISVKKDVNEINELEDIGKKLAIFLWQKLSRIGNEKLAEELVLKLKKELEVRI